MFILSNSLIFVIEKIQIDKKILVEITGHWKLLLWILRRRQENEASRRNTKCRFSFLTWFLHCTLSLPVTVILTLSLRCQPGGKQKQAQR